VGQKHHLNREPAATKLWDAIGDTKSLPPAAKEAALKTFCRFFSGTLFSHVKSYNFRALTCSRRLTNQEPKQTYYLDIHKARRHSEHFLFEFCIAASPRGAPQTRQIRHWKPTGTYRMQAAGDAAPILGRMGY
jgi:hypothetical protein